MPAPQIVLDLIERFRLHRESYEAADYKEAQLRQEFIDPLLKALGWDVDNEQGFAEAYKDVIHEDAIKIDVGTKAPDYCLRIGGTRKYFLESKRPAENIKEHAGHSFQLRRYGWSCKLPLSILTSFAEFSVYDCRIKPHKDDKASVARVMYFTFEQLADKWDEFAGIFSRDAVLKGSFDKYAETNKRKRGTTEVDAAFLAEIEAWRAELAKNLALRNEQLDTRDLNFAVQRIIDRIIFLRIAEDRGIEDYGRLQGLLNGDNVYRRLGEMFRRADERYNSGIFHFETERDRAEPPDELTLDLTIDDRALKEIIKNLYYPDSPYEFSVLSADILGQVYEQFLGKVISLTAGHRAKVEEKPEVKKAGGVYYTPKYIVDYIVEQTVGKLLEGKSPKQAAKLKILDPACGSGSFLIGAYQHLLDWHLQWYLAHDPKNRKDIYQDHTGATRLTLAKRKEILLNNIFGVDIDAQAVEVTKLSLLLKVLEHASREALDRQLRIFHKDRALPDLGQNIKCGNSLIGLDFYNGRQMNLLDDEEAYRVNVFDWTANHGFRDIMKSGGFDAVIGNPPYIRIQGFPRPEIEYLTAHYASAILNADIYVSFVERGLSLLRAGGLFGNILPNKFFKTDYGRGLRKLLANEKSVVRIVDFRAEQVFGATTYTCLLFLQKAPQKEFLYCCGGASREALKTMACLTRHSDLLTDDIWTFENGVVAQLLARIRERSVNLLDLPCVMSRGSSTGCDDAFMFHRGEVAAEPEVLRIPLFATDFGRYQFSIDHDWRVIFPYVRESGRFRLLAEAEFRRNYPNAYRHLLSRKRQLVARKQFKAWYAYSAPRNLLEHDEAQMVIPLLANKGSATGVPNRHQGKLCPMASGGFTIRLSESSRLRPEFVLGCLNSRLLFWNLRHISNIFRGGWITCTKQYVGTLPIIELDLENKSGRKAHERMASLVGTLLSLNQQLGAMRSGRAKTVVERQIQTTDRQIDQLVYELYGLTDEEIRLVEEATN